MEAIKSYIMILTLVDYIMPVGRSASYPQTSISTLNPAIYPLFQKNDYTFDVHSLNIDNPSEFYL